MPLFLELGDCILLSKIEVVFILDARILRYEYVEVRF